MIYGYCRVSSDEQAAHGISIEAQRDILRGYAAMQQSEIKLFEDAGFSGKSMDRPALKRLLSSINSDVTAIVVWKLDRLSRSLRDTLTMIEDIFCACRRPDGLCYGIHRHVHAFRPDDVKPSGFLRPAGAGTGQ